MTRLTGFVLLQAAALLYARGRVMDRRREYAALRSFCDMLDQLRGLLENDASPMPELLRKLSERSTGEARRFAQALSISMEELGTRSFQQLWQQALADEADLPVQTVGQELRALGGVLGRYDLQSQLDALEACRRVIRQAMEERGRTQPQDMYMTVGLALSASLLVGILLL